MKYYNFMLFNKVYRKILLYLMVITGSCLVGFMGNAQSYTKFCYGLKDGLVSPTVSTMYQDTKGYLWLATSGGLCRFDGNSIESFTLRDGVSSYQITSIHEDQAGNLWFRSRRPSDNGLLLFDGRKFRTISPDSLQVLGVGSIYFQTDQIEPLWLKSDKEAFCVHPHKKLILKNFDELQYNYIHQVQEITAKKWLLGTQLGLIVYNDGVYRNVTKQLGKTTQIYAIVPYQNTYWLHTDEGLMTFNLETESFDQSFVPKNLKKNTIHTMLKDELGNMWLATIMGLYQFDGEKFNRFTTKNGLLSNRVRNMVLTSEGNLWLNTEKGLCVRQDTTFVTIEKQDLQANYYGWQFRYRHIMEDHEGNVWYNTTEGVCKFNGFNFLMYNDDNVLATNNVLAFYSDSKNRKWFGYGNRQGLSLCINDTCSWFNTKKNGLENKNVYAINEDQQANVWVATSKGLLRFKENKFEQIKLPNDKDSLAVRHLLIDKKEGLWVGNDDCILYLNNQKITTYELDSFPKVVGNDTYGYQNRLIKVFVDSRNNIWAASVDGLYKLDQSTNSTIKQGFQLMGSADYVGMVVDMDEDDTGILWLVSNQGTLVRYDGKYMMSFDERDGLSNTAIKSIKIVDGYAWLGTTNGIEKINLTNFDANKKLSVYNINQQHGFTPISCNRLQVHDNNGTIWFGIKEGLVAYNQKNHDNLYSPNLKLRITSIKLNFEAVDWAAYTNEFDQNSLLPKNVQLAHHENTLSFTVKPVTFGNLKQLRYQYKLVGKDTSWQEPTKETVVTYQNLNHGNYAFYARVIDGNQVYNANNNMFTFVIETPVWLKWWFWLLLLLGLALSLIALRLLFWLVYQLKKRRAKQYLKNMT